MTSDFEATRADVARQDGFDPVDKRGWWAFREVADEHGDHLFYRASFLDDRPEPPAARHQCGSYLWSYDWCVPVSES